MSIPVALLSKIGNYEVKLGETQVNVNVVTHAAVLDEKLAEFQKTLSERRVVGCDCQRDKWNNWTLPWVMLCTGNRCVVIDLSRVKPVPQSLIKFMSDTSVTFVGMGEACQRHRSIPEMEGIDVVNLGELAAAVRKKPELGQSSLKLLVAAVGFGDADMASTPNRFSWSANVFSEEDMKLVVQDAYYSYLVANKLFAIL